MGYFSDRSIEDMELLYTSSDTNVCADCFNDYAIKEFIRANASALKCDFCGKKTRRNNIAAPFDDVFEFIMEGIDSQWGDPSNEGVGWDGREGGWQGAEVLDGYDVVHYQLGDVFLNEKLLEEVSGRLSNRQFCEIDPYLSRPHEVLKYGWRDFSNSVKHKTRFVFALYREENEFPHPDDLEPADFLHAFGAVLNQHDLVTILPVGAKIYRARINSAEKTYTTAAELGTCPNEKSMHSNRMSPAGIGMFYGAFDSDTATIETMDPDRAKGSIANIAEFELLKPLKVLDLTKQSLPSIPSIFDEKNRHLRDGIIFLRSFLIDLTRPVIKDGREHFEYVPTQVVTEYIRYFPLKGQNKPVFGILYDSAQTGNKACVLFLHNKQCVDVSCDDGILLLKEIKKVNLESLKALN